MPPILTKDFICYNGPKRSVLFTDVPYITMAIGFKPEESSFSYEDGVEALFLAMQRTFNKLWDDGARFIFWRETFNLNVSEDGRLVSLRSRFVALNEAGEVVPSDVDYVKPEGQPTPLIEGE